MEVSADAGLDPNRSSPIQSVSLQRLSSGRNESALSFHASCFRRASQAETMARRSSTLARNQFAISPLVRWHPMQTSSRELRVQMPLHGELTV